VELVAGSATREADANYLDWPSDSQPANSTSAMHARQGTPTDVRGGSAKVASHMRMVIEGSGPFYPLRTPPSTLAAESMVTSQNSVMRDER